jgi:hypothetical protein
LRWTARLLTNVMVIKNSQGMSENKVGKLGVEDSRGGSRDPDDSRRGSRDPDYSRPVGGTFGVKDSARSRRGSRDPHDSRPVTLGQRVVAAASEATKPLVPQFREAPSLT